MRPTLFLLLAFPAMAANRYEIVATLDPVANTVRGTTRLTYVNDTPISLDSIPILCNGVVSHVIRRGGPELKLENHQVILDRPLAPGDSLTLEIEFTTPYPVQNGYHLVNGAWHPKAPVFRDGASQPGEAQADSYDLQVTAPPGEVVAASGKLLEETVTSAGTRRHYTALSITNFGIASSPKFQQAVREAAGVTIRSFYLPEGEKWGPKLADYASKIVSYYQKTFGFYPHEALSILPGGKSSQGGYPVASAMIVVHDTLDRAGGEVFAEWITSHEIGHQYWGWDTVIDSRHWHHWPGLPLGIYSDRLYTEAFNPQSKAHRGFVDTYLGGVSNGYDTTLWRTSDEMDNLSFDANNIIEHGKSFAVIQMLEEVMGREKFLALVRTLLERYRGRYLSPQAFEAVAAEVHGRSLDNFFRQWVRENRVLQYEIASVESGDLETRVTVKRLGDARMPLPLEVQFGDGSKVRKPIDPDPESQVVSFPSAAKPVRAQLDPDNRLALFSPEGGHVWGRKLEVTEIRMPNELAWGSNVAVVKIRNTDDRPHEATIHIQSNVPHRGFGWQTKHTVPAGGEITVDRPFLIGPFPGAARVRVQVMDTTGQLQVGWRRFTTEFALANTRIRPVEVPEALRGAVKFKKLEYPALHMTERGRFIFYTLVNDTWIETQLDQIAQQRESAYAELTRLINPDYHERVAVYLFPDADSKLAYTGHTGMGWNPGGNVLVEICNEKERVDPNHELVHIIAGSIGQPPAILSEGLAAYLQLDHKWDGYPVDAWAKAFQARSVLIPLRQLMRFEDIGPTESKPPIAYPEAASVVKYLVECYGWDKLLRAYRELKPGGEDQVSAIFGEDLGQIEKGWLARLAATPSEAVPEDQVSKAAGH